MPTPLSKERLLSIIEKAKKENWKQLDLSNKGLTELPKEIGTLTNLIHLDLGSNLSSSTPNRLSHLPPEIGNLSKLEHLNLRFNYEISLPSEMGNLVSLKKLNLSRTLIKIPSVIGELKNLEELIVNDNEFDEFPKVISNLSKLKVLDLGRNHITICPSGISNLQNLTLLDLHDNRFIILPKEIGQLKNLKKLYLNDNALKEIPEEFCKLQQLMELDLDYNEIRNLPQELGNLSNLESMRISNNKIDKLPIQIGNLRCLKYLLAYHNNLTYLPPEIGVLPNLKYINVDGNPLVSPPQEIVKQGTRAIRIFLNLKERQSSRQWQSRLIVVGEGGVGKTSLIKALKNENFNREEKTTLGIDVSNIQLPHPFHKDVVMTLKTWDFASQVIYDATHQFFLTEGSLFLVVWNARLGWEQGSLYRWLDLIHAKAPKAPIMIVATHTDEREADLPSLAIKQKFSQVVGIFSVSNDTKSGINYLRMEIQKCVANLPLMGESWPTTWLNFVKAIENHKQFNIGNIDIKTILIIANRFNISEEDLKILLRWLHELGEILYFENDDEINNLIILNSDWVIKKISLVLESKEVIKQQGVLTDATMDDIWPQLPVELKNHFLRLMEKFDLSYRTLENKDVSLVVKRLPLDPPDDLQSKWNSIKHKGDCKEIKLKFQLNTIPPGIPTWFIAHSHRFTTYTHWRKGALFAYGTNNAYQAKQLALVQVFDHERCIQLTVRGSFPYIFFALLMDGIELTLSRYPGLKVARLIPCPNELENGCHYQFNYDNLRKRLDRQMLEVECQECFSKFSVIELLLGIHSTQDHILQKLEVLDTRIKDVGYRTREGIIEEISTLRELVQRELVMVAR